MSTLPESYSLVLVDEDDCSDEEVLSGCVEVFHTETIHVSSIEKMLFAVMHSGKVVGAAAFGSSRDEIGLCLTFSVAVLGPHQRKGIGEQLVRAVLEHVSATEWGEGYYFRVWVVNPHMARLLGRMGFETERAEWTPGAPHMYKWC